MEIHLFDERTIAPAGVIETHTAFNYIERYRAPGEWNIWGPLDRSTKKYMDGDYLVALDPKGGLFGVLRGREKDTKSARTELLFSGKTVQRYLDERIVWGTYSGNKAPSEMAYDLVIQSMITPVPVNPRRVIPGVIVDPTRDIFGDPKDFQITSRPVEEGVTKLLEPEELGYKFFTDIKAHTHKFQVYRGTNRSLDQRDVPWVVFSKEFDNIISSKYQRQSENYKNVAYVGGPGEGPERVWVPVNDDLYSGLDRKELPVDARDIQEGNVTQLLITRGLEKLGECQEVENFEGDIITDGRFQYGRDYFLGDIVTFEDKDIGLTLNARVTQVETVYRGNNKQVIITFGFQMPSLKSIINR